MIRTASALSLGLLLASANLAAAEPSASPAFQADTAESAAEAARTARFDAEYQALQATLVEQLTRSANPRDWALVPDYGSALRRERLVRAADAAPDDALVQWLAVNALFGTDTTKGTDPAAQRIGAQLLAVQPDNAAHLLPALSQADRQADPLAIDQLLSAMAARSRFDIHFGDGVHAWLDLAERSDTAATLDAIGKLDAEQNEESVDPALGALVFGVAQLAAANLPAYQYLFRACHPEKDLAAQSRRVDDCEKLARLMTGQGQTMIDRMIGDALLRKIERQSEADRAQRRRWDWMMEAYAEISNEAGAGPALAATWRNSDDELEVMTQTLQAAGVALDPPSDWVSRSEARIQETAQRD